MKKLQALLALMLILCLVLGTAACAAPRQPADTPGEGLVLLTSAPEKTQKPDRTPAPAATPKTTDAGGNTADPKEKTLDPEGSYTTKEDVALYIHLYGELPRNFMTKSEARALGWSGGGLDKYADGMCIGGDRFGNYEGLLPKGSYRECDIDTLHASSRGAKRLIYSDDGRIYYTGDHYASFTLLYGEE